MKFPPSFAQLSNQDLLEEIRRLAVSERQATTRLIACLMEVDARRLYLGEGCSSLFTYCTQVLHLSEHAAYRRIEAARAARRFPRILEALADGAITLTTVGLLAPHLTAENHVDLLEAARDKRKRDVEHLVAALHPRPDVPSAVRKLPNPKPPVVTPVQDASEPARLSSVTGREAGDHGFFSAPPSTPARLTPLAPERYKVQFTVSRETYDKLRRAQDLLRHVVPTGDTAAIFDRALTLLVVELERAKLAATDRPHRATTPSKGHSRHIPAAVKRAVWTRDAGRCAFVGAHGRCSETGFLEFHHVAPYATGGLATVENIELRCAAHNSVRSGAVFRAAPAGAHEGTRAAVCVGVRAQR